MTFFRSLSEPVVIKWPRCAGSEAARTIDMVDYALDRKVRADVGPVAGKRAEAAPAYSARGLDWLDCALICLFLLGLYTNYTVQISAKVPFPSAPAGIAGLILLWRRRDPIHPQAL